MTAAKELDVISRLPDCSGEASDAVSAYTRVKMEDAPDLLRLSFLCFCGRHQNGWKEEPYEAYVENVEEKREP